MQLVWEELELSPISRFPFLSPARSPHSTAMVFYSFVESEFFMPLRPSSDVKVNVVEPKAREALKVSKFKSER